MQLLNLQKVSEAYRLILENREKKHKSIFNFGTIFSDAGSKTNTEKKKETTKSEKPEPEQKGIRGSDRIYHSRNTFEESILGCRKEITVQHEEICPCSKEENHTDNCTICNNTGKVLKKFIYDISIPRGIFSGQVLKIKGKGNVGINGGENGDLVINIQVKQKKGFVRTGQDVVYYMTISFPQAVLGAVINVPTAYGTVNCEIPAGIKTGEQLCLAGKGVIDEETGEVGCQYVNITIDIPKIEKTEDIEILLRQVQDKLYDKPVNANI